MTRETVPTLALVLVLPTKLLALFRLCFRSEDMNCYRTLTLLVLLTGSPSLRVTVPSECLARDWV